MLPQTIKAAIDSNERCQKFSVQDKAEIFNTVCYWIDQCGELNQINQYIDRCNDMIEDRYIQQEREPDQQVAQNTN